MTFTGSTQELGALIRRYKTFRQDEDSRRFDAFRTGFGRLRAGLEPLMEAWKARRKLVTPYFNVFRILHRQHLEALTHSPMLAHLLNPLAHHEQGGLFLEAFFEQVQKAKLSCALRFKSEQRWMVREEPCIHIQTEAGEDAGRAGRRLDVVLECLDPKWLLVIENKIHAKDQLSQIPDYRKWMRAQKDFEERWLIFLTPDGRKPESGDGFADVICMSYRDHIRVMLETAMEKIHEAPRLRETLQQYLEVVNELSTEIHEEM